MTQFCKAVLRSATCLSIFVAAGTSAHAQQADESVDADTIIVTGSRIARPNDESPVPISTITAAEVLNTGRVSVGDTLNDLPQLRTTFGQGQNTTSLGVSGLNLLDLRGLGPQRTLTLVNGRRHVGADILNNGVSVDVNTIPTELIKSVDIVTGGNSAVYGSDAIAGVVNFILKDDFEGITASGQAGISDKGDAGTQRISLTAGTNFADGRGNVAVSGEYTHQSPFFASQRRSGRVPTTLVPVDIDPPGTLNGSDGIADRRFLNDVRFATLAPGGLTNFATRQCGQGSNETFFDCIYRFQPDGTLIPQTGQRVGLGPNGSFLGGNGATNREGELLGLLTKNERYGINLVGHYEFTPAVVAFIEAKYFRSDTLSTGAGPAFIQGSTLGVFGGDARERPRLDNPFLSEQARSLITQQLSEVATLNGTAQPTGASRFNLRNNLVDLGLRQERAERDTFRIVGGLRGDLSDHLRYEVSANYGRFKETTTVLGNVNTQRLLLALDATRNASGQIVCRSQVDPAAAISLAGNDAAARRLAGDVSACVPVNLFGPGNASQAARDYIIQDTVAKARITQFDVTAFVSGDTGSFLNLPGGPVGFVLGGEYRRETNRFTQDTLLTEGLTFYNSIAPFRSPAFEVKELFGELRIPILANVPFFNELTLSGAGRVADYKGSAGTTYAYNVNLEYSPFESLRFRGGFARALRAPNLSELYTAQGDTFAGNFADPCSDRNIGSGSGSRAANCAADGRPAGFDYAYTSSLGYKQGGNPDLKSEYSNSWTAGVVFSPEFMPGFTFSADFYDITVKNVILTLDGQVIVDQCYDAASLDNPFCGLFQRNRSGATLATGEEPFRIIEGSLLSSGVNFAKLKVRGIDFDVAYRHDFGAVELESHLVYTLALKSEGFTDPTSPDLPDRSLGETGEPKHSFNWNVDLDFGPWQFGYQLRYIGKQAIVTNEIENLISVGGEPPLDADFAERNHYPAVFYHNVRLGVDVSERFNWYLGVDNVLDRKVPFNQTGSGSSAAGADVRIFDNRGRYFFSGFVAKF